MDSLPGSSLFSSWVFSCPLVMSFLGYCDYHYSLGGVGQRVKKWSYQIFTQSGLTCRGVGEVKIRPREL